MKKVICRGRLKKKSAQVSATKLVFRPAVYGVIIRDNKVLLVPEWGDGYDFPGGGIGKGETIEEALLREVKEETGLSVKKRRLLACETDFFYDTSFSSKPYHSILIYFLCTNPRGRISAAGFDPQERKYARKAEWIDISKVAQLKFYNALGQKSIKLIQHAQKLLKK